ncbi:class I adenylate-forming enzyme family protein [Gimesia aquarii]|uniref:Long-chain-fatty-acid--CoA ligase n=1 Tax=Gimesia aquarii TaxID=2527964 RepID=A0A517WQ64_9PLAN|nr:AMP-binding protein [Gimesia aquarii]QDU07407.1 Long-chain-fatty-acid--CoA ligase [Gimesia aquarii]
MLLQSFLEYSAQFDPNKIALIVDQRRYTYLEIEQQSNRLAHAFLKRGLKRGNRVVIHLDNTLEATVAVFAVLKAGGVFVMVNPTTKIDKLTYVLNNCQAHALIIPDKKRNTLFEHSDLLPHLKTVITVGSNSESKANNDLQMPQFDSWVQLQAEFADCITPPPITAISIDLAALVYTSGSTGNPKGVMLTHLNMTSAARSITTYLMNESNDIILNVLPLSFDYGLYQLLMAFRVGATLVLEKSFTYPHAVLQRIIDEKVTGFPLVPTMSAILLKMDLSKYDFSKLRYITNTGAALPTEHILTFRKRLPHVQIFSMYGLTECKRVSYLPLDQVDIRTGSVGIAMPDTEVFIVDDAGHRLPPEHVGELVVRGANVMKGYWEAPEQTAERLRPAELPNEMYLYTGDLFRMDKEGYLYFVGRRDDIIKSRGEKVSPKEVENVLFAHERISEAAIMGDPDPVLGQSIRAIITLMPDQELSEKEALAYCRKHLEDFMVPQKIEFRDELPKSPNGKVDKKQLVLP